jgi:hypothetical protein
MLVFYWLLLPVWDSAVQNFVLEYDGTTVRLFYRQSRDVQQRTLSMRPYYCSDRSTPRVQTRQQTGVPVGLLLVEMVLPPRIPPRILTARTLAS